MNIDYNDKEYMRNAQGHLVPVGVISEIDIERDKLVKELIKEATELRNRLTAFKKRAVEDIQAFIELSAEKYGAKMRGSKGNISLYSFDGKFKIMRAVSDRIVFDERLQAAKEMIDECLIEWVKDGRQEVKALIMSAFEVDKQGKINTQRILSLKKLDIKDERWQEAMAAISDSIQVNSSVIYIRFYERVGNTDKYESIELDFASI